MTARAYDRISIYAGFSAMPGQVFNTAVLGQEVANLKRKNLVTTNDIQMIAPGSWLPAIDEFQRTGRIPEYAYQLTPSLLLTDDILTKQTTKNGLCAAQAPLLPYTTPDIPRPTSQQIRHFFRKSNQVVSAAGSFASIDYHLTRSIEAASQTIFADPDYRKATSSMVSLLLKAHNLRR